MLGIPSSARNIGAVEMAEGEENAVPDLPAAFQEDCWGDDDEYECEEEDVSQNDLESRQREAKEAGMIQVGVEGWREAVKRKLSDITAPGLNWEEIDHAIDAIEKAGKATCVVRRGCDSRQRLSYHERMAEAASSEADREKHCKRLRTQEITNVVSERGCCCQDAH